MVHYIASVGRRLRDIQARYPDWFTGIGRAGAGGSWATDLNHPGPVYV